MKSIWYTFDYNILEVFNKICHSESIYYSHSQVKTVQATNCGSILIIKLLILPQLNTSYFKH